MSTVASYEIRVINDDLVSENKIHSDETAQKYGFTGALVTGVGVFGYLSQPLVRAYGSDWLSNTVADVFFRKPAYDDDALTVRTEDLSPDGAEGSTRHHLTTGYNAEGTVLAKLESWQPLEMPAIDARAHIPGAESQPTRAEISWDGIQIDVPVESFLWQPSRETNDHYLETQRDKTELFHLEERPYIHPHHLLSECNKTLMRIFELPAWIHTGSRMTLRRALRIGDEIEIRCIPTEKWEKKGHEFIKLYIAMWCEGKVAVEVEHTAIFKIAE